MKPSCTQVGVCGIDVGEVHGDVIRCDSGEMFRYVMAGEPTDRSAIVGSDIDDVDPLNLIAALKKDNPERLVMTLDSDWGLSFSENAVKAGVDRSISREDLGSILAQCHEGPAKQDAVDVDVPVEKEAHPVPDAADADSGICMSVVSGRGGVGKSTLCLMLALAAKSQGLRVIVLDMDMQFGDLNFLCNQDSSFSPIGYGLGGTELDFRKLGAGAIPVLYPMEKPEYSELLSKETGQLLDRARKGADLVLVNTGSFWTDIHADLMSWSDVVLFVMDQRASSIRGCRAARDLCIRMGIPSSRFCFVLNRCTNRGHVSIYDCAISLGVDEVHEVPDGGPEVEEAFSLGVPSSFYDEGGPLVESLEEVVSSTLARFGIKTEGSKARGSKSTFRGLFGRKAGGGNVSAG